MTWRRVVSAAKIGLIDFIPTRAWLQHRIAMPRLFISYRRDDSAFAAQAIYDKLKELFGEESITFDVNFSLGVDFAKKIDESVCRCDVLLAVIGDRWLDLRFADGPMQGQRRLDDPNDWVRLEIASALRRDILVVPVLVGKVSMPDISPGLPPDLADLTKKVALSVRSGPDLPNDLQLLVRGVKRAIKLSPLTPSDLALPPGVKIVPQGLRSFDENDNGFFIYLLPGPYREDGLPERLGFWKTRIEAADADSTFRVGLIYGPSGCGKSSLVRAGLLPRLDKHVTPVYVEATATDTEARLLAELHKHCPYLAGESSLLAALRRKDLIPSDKKVLVVLDQFEQYLHSTPEEEQDELAEALRECDGGKLQCILMVRDDFLTPVSRFMKRLEIPMADNHNLALVDLFDRRHAKKVLALLGQAYGGLPTSGSLRKEQDAFLNQAVSDLCKGDHVICVRLALFAAMVKDKEWKPATLKAVGGATGVGVAFLEDSFVAQTAPAENRRHKAAAQRVLAALLPEPGTSIKGAMRTKQELLKQSGYARRPEQFSELLDILDKRLRLVTPTDPVTKSSNGQSEKSADAERRYQLTHDYLVPSLRDWLTSKKKETRRGRAELRLAERSELWTAKPENRHLPSLWEFLNIRLLTNGKNWTGQQQKMVQLAGRVHGIRSGIAAAVLIALLLGGLAVSREIEERKQADYAAALVAQLDSADTAEALGIFDKLADCGRWAGPPLTQEVIKLAADSKRMPEQASEDEKERLAMRQANVAVALLRMGKAESVWPLLKFSPDPRVRSYIIHWASPAGVDPQTLIERLQEETDVTVRRALIVTMGGFSDTQLSVAQRQRLMDKLPAVYENEPDAGLHAAAEWLLRKWGQGDRLQAVVEKLRGTEEQLQARKATDKRQWYINTQGQTFVILDAGEFLMGSPESEPGRRSDETQHRCHIGRRFAISSTHVTRAQFGRFQTAHPEIQKMNLAQWVKTDDSPQTSMTWYEAAAYCNWLSEQEGIVKEQWCYEPNERGEYGPGMKAKDNYLKLSSYRLPTTAEWEFACRAGTVTSRYYGLTDTLLAQYAWNLTNGQNRTWQVGSLKPNDFGLFDMHGNVWEWCNDRFRIYPEAANAVSEDLGSPGPVTDDDSRALRGGSFGNQPVDVRSAYRITRLLPSDRNYADGFRPARTLPLDSFNPVSK